MNRKVSQVAKELIEVARHGSPYSKLQCLDCLLLPLSPVTGKCGHTRCKECIEDNGPCPCGCPPPPRPLQVNFYVEDLISKILTINMRFFNARSTLRVNSGPAPVYGRFTRLRRNGHHRPHPYSLQRRSAESWRSVSNPMSLTELLRTNDHHVLSLDLRRAVLLNTSTAWLQPEDLECVICCNTLNRPVTTDCGHTFCCECILRTIQQYRGCALCRHPLDVLSVALASDTKLVSSILSAVTPAPAISGIQPQRAALVPIFDCEMVFPSMSCHIVFDTSRMTTLRRILDSGKRRFGILAKLPCGRPAIMGTVIEVRDCVTFEDGSATLTVIGVCRFQIKHGMIDEGTYKIATVEVQIDEIPPRNQEENLDNNGEFITNNFLNWYKDLSPRRKAYIHDTFGTVRLSWEENNWWLNPHGAEWLWWMIAVMAFCPSVKVQLLSTSNVWDRIDKLYYHMKRMIAGI